MTSFTCSVHLRSSLSQVPNNLNSSTLSINCLIFQGERCSVSVKIIHFRHLLGGNNHLLTNNKLCKIGCVQEDKCSLCKTDSESLYLIVFECRHTKQFWKEFQYYFYTLTREFVCLTLQDVITGILYTNCPLLNYLILIAKLYLWGCRRNQTLPVITAFSSKVKIKYETEKSICVKTNKQENFNKKWALPLDSVP